MFCAVFPAAPVQHRQVELFRHLADVVFGGQHAVYMAVDGQPAVAFRIGTRLVEGAGGPGQLAHQGRVGGVDRREGHGQEDWGLCALAAIMARGHSQRGFDRRAARLPALPALLALAALAALMGVAEAGGARAQSPSPNQPLAIDGPGALVPSPCNLVVPADQAVLQPRKIRPEEVPLKNRLGCLSPADAVYGPDGCPVRLCGPGQGAFPLTAP